MKSFFKKHILARFFSDELSSDEETDLLNRRSIVSRMEQEWNLPEGNDTEFGQHKVWKQIITKIQQTIINPHKRTVLLWRLPVAASILMLMGVGYYWLFSGQTVKPEIRMLVYETQNEERLRLVLPDSTKIWLNAGSRIEYPENFGPDIRQVKLSGEAYFDVTRKAESPFYVSTGKLQLSVLGTQFTVSDYNDDSLAETVLISGKVNVNILSDSVKRFYELSPNEQLFFEESQKSTTIRTVDASLYTGWVNGRLSFENVELERIINRLERWYGKKIECPKDMGIRYRLTFTVRNESLEQILQLIESVVPVYFQQADGIYHVKPHK